MCPVLQDDQNVYSPRSLLACLTATSLLVTEGTAFVVSRLLGLRRLVGLRLLVRSRSPRMRGCRRHLTSSPQLVTTTSGEGGFGRVRLMPVRRFHGLSDLLVAVGKEKHLGGGASEQDAVDGRKVGGIRHQLANGLCLLVEDAGGNLRAHVRGILDLGLPGCHILADILSPPLELVDVLLGSAVQRRERSLAGGIDLVSEGAGGFRACQGDETASTGCVSPQLHVIKGLAFHKLGAK
jgi:hypothetical protein